MKLSYVQVPGDKERRTVTATVTTDHAASSYGQPVIVRSDDGTAVDLFVWLLYRYQIEEANEEEMGLLRHVFSTGPSMAASVLGSRTSEKKADAHTGAGGKPG